MSIYSRTLPQLRQDLSLLVGDHLVGTADSSTTTTSIKDDFLTSFNDDHFNGWEACGYGLTNTPTAIITDFVKSTGVATLASAITGMASGAGYELHDITRKWRKAEYDIAINLAIDYLSQLVMIDKADVTLEMAASTYEYTIPSGFVAIRQIFPETSTANLYEAKPISPDLWGVQIKLVSTVPTAIIVFDRDNWTPTASRNLRVIGQSKQDRLSTETGATPDTCLINPDLVLSFALANLHIYKGQLAEGVALLSIAQGKLPSYRRGIASNSKMVNL